MYIVVLFMQMKTASNTLLIKIEKNTFFKSMVANHVSGILLNCSGEHITSVTVFVIEATKR